MKNWIVKSDDERAVFANYACKLLVEKHKGDIEAACKDALKLKVYFQNNVRNFYELIRLNVPLFSLYDYDDDREDYEWFLEDRGYDLETARENIVENCKMFYCS